MEADQLKIKKLSIIQKCETKNVKRSIEIPIVLWILRSRRQWDQSWSRYCRISEGLKTSKGILRHAVTRQGDKALKRHLVGILGTCQAWHKCQAAARIRRVILIEHILDSKMLYPPMDLDPHIRHFFLLSLSKLLNFTLTTSWLLLEVSFTFQRF